MIGTSFRRENTSDDLDPIIDRCVDDTDLVLTEGYQRGSFPKIKVHRSARSDQLICSSEETLALVTDKSWSTPSEMDV